MTRLADLHPEWILDGERRAGISFSCPCCTGFAINLLFSNPIGGGPPLRQNHRTLGDHSGLRFARSGETFETLSIEGPILSSKANHWHGRVSSGEVSQ